MRPSEPPASRSSTARRRVAAEGRPSDVFAGRRDRLARQFKKAGLDALLISDRANVHYLTGFRGDDSWLIVAREKSLILSDSRFVDQIQEECPGLEAEIRPPGAGKTLIWMTQKVVKNLGVSSVGFESRYLVHADATSLPSPGVLAEFVPTHDLVETLRAVKDRSEIQTVREAISVAERAFTVLRASLRGEDREKDLADRLESTIRSLGGEGSAFPPICAVGERAALPHAVPGKKQVHESPILLVDWGARWCSYNSDLTRVLVTGPPTSKLEKVYQTVLSAQKRAIEAIRPGALTGQIDRIARQTIEDAGFGRYFGHSLGHGLGLKVHEAPGLRQGMETPLQPGMIVTVEPGIYLPEWGGVRIEDDVLVTKDGHEVLSHVPKEFEQSLALISLAST